MCAVQPPLCVGETSVGNGKRERKRNTAPRRAARPSWTRQPFSGEEGQAPAVPEAGRGGASAGTGTGTSPAPSLASRGSGRLQEPQPTWALGRLQPSDADMASPRHPGQQIHTPVWVGLQVRDCFPGGSAAEESACNVGDPGSIPGLGRSIGEGIGYPLQYSWASLVAQLVKNPPAMWETWVPSLGQEDPLEKGKATHSSILAWRIPWTV